MASKVHKAPFRNPSLKNKLIREWEVKTGQVWPRYAQDVLNKDGGIWFKQGSQWQAHHIIPQQRGGPHEWWNMKPTHVFDHQGGLHKPGGPLSKLLNPKFAKE